MALATVAPYTYMNPYDFIGPVIVLGALILLVGAGYLILKFILGGGTVSSKIESAKRGYYYLLSFITLSILYFAASDTLSLLLSTITGSNYYGYSYENFARGIALRAAVLIVVLPVYIYHWFAASKQVLSPDEEVRSFAQRERKGYVQIVLTFSTIILIITGVRFIYLLLLLGLGVSGVELSSFTMPFSYSLGILAIWLYHLKILKENS
ncbi:hypothetical protein A2716_05025 [candidate division WWE3 bacterium RIFCSPHIGHO2_01_FULL_40_23]|uniref:DUF5671 domain-containing protein n=1 Tax=candidate division WWE3 bacterium RIFCSPLOWO2_01_FULL_41_18 TaxID=1802625 RepID=A0A1F4VEV7_UNCKA|nr:MAG: hypothetical protein A2716_05025 [candidate division WWE3 bacterium RIFCSPHIGHO2_01_FULL_40_23]OGC55233.1 MAG: hypothetical protein A3A78_04635 [candidate division WWE3 bacterium RIFCSPLOWO2_01_FULL_41_18]